MSSPGEEAIPSSSSLFSSRFPSSSSKPAQPTAVIDGPTASGPIDVVDPSALLIKVLSPADNFPSDLGFRVLPKSTVGELKRRISAVLDLRPENDQQRLIYRGKMLTDELVVENVLGLAPGKDGGTGETPQEAYTFHLVIRPPAVSPTTVPPNPFSNLGSSSNPAPLLPPSLLPPPQPTASPLSSSPTTTTTTTRSFTPGSNSSIVTTTTRITTTTILPGSGPPSVPSATNAQNFSTMSLDELRQTLRQRAQSAEQQQNNPAARQRLTDDLTRMNEVLGHRITAARQNFNTASEGLGRSTGLSIPGLGSGRTETPATRYGSGRISTPTQRTPTPGARAGGSATGSSEGTTGMAVVQPQEMRGPATQLLNLESEARRRALLEMQQEEAEQVANFTTPGTGGRPTTFSPPIQQPSNNLLGGNNLIYLLQDASGMPTALLVGPPGSALPSAPAPHLGIRWQPGFAMPMGPNFDALRAMGFPAPEVANRHHIFNPGAFGFDDPHARAAMNRRNRNPMNIREVLAGVRARAGHFWLAVRLAVFVVLFTGTGGWKRMLYLGSIAALIFIWQTGIFNEFLRPIADAINPPPPNAGAFPAPGPAPAPVANPNQPQFQNQPIARDANGNPITPEQTANMLVARRNEGIWEIFRGVERGVTIFLASLIPGLHERHVDAVEARQREVQQLREAQEAATGGAAEEGQAQPQQGAEAAPAGGNGAGPVPDPEVIRGLL